MLVLNELGLKLTIIIHFIVLLLIQPKKIVCVLSPATYLSGTFLLGQQETRFMLKRAKFIGSCNRKRNILRRKWRWMYKEKKLRLYSLPLHVIVSWNPLHSRYTSLHHCLQFPGNEDA